MSRAKETAPKVVPWTAPPSGVVVIPVGLGLLGLMADGVAIAAMSLGGPLGFFQKLALFHLAVVGGLLPVVLGAMAQLSAATTGRPFRWPALQAVGPALVWAGGLCLFVGFEALRPPWLAAGGLAALVGLGVSAFGPAVRAWGERPFTPLHLGIGVGAASLVLTALFGTWMALAMAGVIQRPQTLAATHALTGLVLGFSVLLYGVAWQLVSMFGQTPYPSRSVVFAGLSGLVLVGGLAAFDGGMRRLWLDVLVAVLAFQSSSLTSRLARAHGGFRPRTVPLATLVWSWQLTLAVGWVAWDPSSSEGAVVLAVFGGFVLAAFSFLERILPFVIWIGLQRVTLKGRQAPKVTDIVPERHFWPGLALLEAGVWATVVFGERGGVLLGVGLAAAAALALWPVVQNRSLFVLGGAGGPGGAGEG